MEKRSADLSQQRVIRVFVSSTFRDMQAEREELIKRIFPQLRKMCELRGVTWGEVDLRWGVTDEQKAEGKVLPICLSEIQKCRPYFIGLIGERYGWVPEEIPQKIIEEEKWKWIGELPGHSVTELEIMHGVLRNPDMANHAFFYFRDPDASKKLEPELAKYPDYKPESVKSLAKLSLLKQKIENSGFPLRKGYPDAKALGGLVLKDFTDVINNLYPKGSQPDPLEREAIEHEIFAKSRARVYIGRQEYFDVLDQHAGRGGLPLVVIGESGSGKSALLANWALKYKADHPQELMLMHFVGASASSIDWVAMLRRIMAEFKRYFVINQDVPEKPDEVRSAFANWLHMAAAKGKVILIIDALNQLEDREGAQELLWLPPVIPANVRLIVSTLPGKSLEELQKRAYPILQVKFLEMEERKRFISDYLALYTKALSPERAERIYSSSRTANPLFLQALIEELRVFGVYEKLDERIGFYLKAKSIPELFGKILSRYEQDYDNERPDLVKDSMSLIWSARRGLSEAELLELLGKKDNPLPGAVWAPLYLAAESSLVNRAGLLNFFHDYFRQAVENKYINTDEEKKRCHLRLADYFDSQELGPRKVDELPWQLAEASEWKKLFYLFADLTFFHLAWQSCESDVYRYWTKIESNSPLRTMDAYGTIHEHLTLDVRHLVEASALLDGLGHIDQASSLLSTVIERYKNHIDDEILAVIYGTLANVEYLRGNFEKAMSLHKDAERIFRERGFEDLLSPFLSGQAQIYQSRGELDKALELFTESERLHRVRGDREGLQICLGNIGNILCDRGELDVAMSLHKQRERICRELGNINGLQACIGSQAVVFKNRGQMPEALALYKEKEHLCWELGNKDGLRVALSGQGRILHAIGDFQGALALYDEARQICCASGLSEGLVNVLHNKAVTLRAIGRTEEALACLKDQETVFSNMGLKLDLLKCLNHQKVILREAGREDDAISVFSKMKGLGRTLGLISPVAEYLIDESSLLQKAGRTVAALAIGREAYTFAIESGNRDLVKKARLVLLGIQGDYGNHAQALMNEGDLEGAMALHKESELTFRELSEWDDLACCLTNQAALLAWRMGRFKDAVPLAEEAFNLANEKGLTALSQQIKPILDSICSRQ